MDDSKLERIKGDIQYEVDMIRFTLDEIQRIKEANASEEDNTRKHYYNSLENCISDAFLIYIRCLRDFFCGSRDSRKHNDAHAEDYVKEPEKWHANRPNMDYIEDHERKNKLDKLLAHLSYSRAEYAAKRDTQWDLRKMEKEILESWKFFLQCLPDERRKWFSDPGVMPLRPPIVSDTSSATTYKTEL